MEEYTPEVQESQSVQFKRWFQDNLRIIVSIAVVVVIAGGIYSYSKRGNSPVVSDQTAQSTVDDQASSNGDQKASATTDTKSDKQVSSAATSTETETSFVETAGRGDSLTVLARRAAANYLEKNPDSTLTKEHKIYIEDYLRKNVGRTGGVKVGSSVEFSKDLVTKAIEQSKKLSAGQLKHLQKYSARVSTL